MTPELTQLDDELTPAEQRLEDAIDRAYWQLCGAPTPDTRRRAHDRMTALISQRTPHHVAVLERRRGLTPTASTPEVHEAQGRARP